MGKAVAKWTAARARHRASLKRLNYVLSMMLEQLRESRDQLGELNKGASKSARRSVIRRAKHVYRVVEFFLEWYCVMLVTYAEAYLQDVLAASANSDPQLMEKSEQLAP